jgi:protein ImuB
VAALTRIACLLALEPSASSPSAQRALIEVALACSPRVEEGGPGLVYLDVAGLRGLFGSEEEIALRLMSAAADRGLRTRVGIAGSRISALCACRWGDGVTIVAPGGEAAYLASAPLSLLELSVEMGMRLERWGIRTLGELAALPPAQLFERLGADGLRLQQVARGEDPRPLRPWQPPRIFEASAALDGAVETLEPLIALMATLAERIADQLIRSGLSADQFEWSCHLADGTRHEGSLAPAFPMNEGAAVALLLRTALEARPPRHAVEAITLQARPVRVAPAQASLTDPFRPSPRLVTATLTRLAALVGARQIGVPALLDSHRPDAVQLAPYSLGDVEGDPQHAGRVARATGSGKNDAAPSHPALALRRFRPPLPASVTLVSGRPVELRSKRLSARIVISAGPWRTSGEWWTEAPWLRDEWDVELGDGTVCRLAHDGSAWWLDGLYD